MPEEMNSITPIASLAATADEMLRELDQAPPAEALDKIFIPFFTTKKEGSGIGLSLSRQIMRLRGGTLNVFSEPDRCTRFALRFRPPSPVGTKV